MIDNPLVHAIDESNISICVPTLLYIHIPLMLAQTVELTIFLRKNGTVIVQVMLD
jgi:hypothetical protein